MEPYILHIETATNICSVALSKGENLVGLKETTEKNSHAEVLTLLIEQVLNENQIDLADLNAIAFSEGPGSYTGLRIGASVAKGLCYSLQIPFINISTLQSMAAGAVSILNKKDGYYCPLIDARRMEVYTAVYDYNLNQVLEPQPLIIETNSFSEILKNHKLYFFGDGAEKCEEMISSSNANFVKLASVSAKNLISLAFNKYISQIFTDITYFEPSYLKNYYLNRLNS